MIWDVATFLDTLEDALKARDAFAGVTVETAHPGKDKVRSPALIITGVLGEQEPGTMGNNDDTRYQAVGFIFSQIRGAGPQNWKAARDTARDLFADLGTYLKENHTVGDTVGRAAIGTFDFIQGANDYRWCRIDFEINVTALS